MNSGLRMLSMRRSPSRHHIQTVYEVSMDATRSVQLLDMMIFERNFSGCAVLHNFPREFEGLQQKPICLAATRKPAKLKSGVGQQFGAGGLLLVTG